MALAAPTAPTRYAGGNITAGVYKADVTDSVAFLTNPPDFVGTQSAVQSIPSGTWTPISLDTEQLDTYNGHSTSSNPSRYVCQQTGWYTVSGVVSYAINGTSSRGARLQVNGVSVPGTAGFVPTNSSTAITAVTPTRDIYLTQGDYLEVAAWQGTGGALSSFVATDAASALWARFSHA